MPFCGKCGEKLGDDLNFCPVCGAKVVKSDSSRNANSGQESAEKPIQQNTRQTTRQNAQPQWHREFSCFLHAKRPAVSRCGNCGVGLCQECEQDAFFRTDNGHGKAICDRCSLKAMEADVNYDEKWLRKSRFKLIFGGFFIILGAIPLTYVIMMRTRYANSIFEVIVYWAIACAILSIGNKNPTPSVKDQVYDAISEYEHPFSNWLIGILVKALFAPIFFITNIVFHIKARKAYKSDVNMLTAIQKKVTLEGFYAVFSDK